MISEIRIDLTNFFERCPWGVVYYDEDHAVVGSDYCSDAEDCAESVRKHKGEIDESCLLTALVEVPAFPSDMDALASFISSLGERLSEEGVSVGARY